jgi:hypothetical protein
MKKLRRVSFVAIVVSVYVSACSTGAPDTGPLAPAHDFIPVEHPQKQDSREYKTQVNRQKVKHPHDPLYEGLNPVNAFGARVAFNGFPVSTAIGNTFQVFWEHDFAGQDAGIFSAGIHAGLLPISVYNETGIVPYPNDTNFTGGVSVRYQFRYLYNQLIVPTLGAELDYYAIKTNYNGDQWVNGINPGVTAGLMLNLSFFDTDTAVVSYRENSLVRSYFTFDVRSVRFQNDAFYLDGFFWMFGLRLEYN